MTTHTDETKPRLLDQVRELIRIRHYSIRTEQAYLQWIRRIILFHGKRHPRDMGAPELTAFLSDLAIRRNVAASTQNQALNAILFLYRDVLKISLPWLDDVQRAKKPQRLPVVLTRDEIRSLLAQLQGTIWLMAALIYGGGLRLLECLRLRVKDIDFQYKQLIIRDAKGQKDRVTILPQNLVVPLRSHLTRAGPTGRRAGGSGSSSGKSRSMLSVASLRPKRRTPLCLDITSCSPRKTQIPRPGANARSMSNQESLAEIAKLAK